MKKAILNFLLSRGVPKLQQAASKLVRHGVTALGGASLLQGLLTGADLATLGGAGTILVSVALSLGRVYLAGKLAE